jgi:hypothetical protein
MDGRIWVESEPQRGSAFHFVITLPVSDQVIPQNSCRVPMNWWICGAHRR